MYHHKTMLHALPDALPTSIRGCIRGVSVNWSDTCHLPTLFAHGADDEYAMATGSGKLDKKVAQV